MITAAQARVAHDKAKIALHGCGSIGITNTANGDFAVHINLLRAPVNWDSLPREIDGVPIIYDVIGDIDALEE